MKKLKASKFLEWYFSDEEDLKHIGQRIEFLLKKNGSAFMTPEYLFNEQDELPNWICEDQEGTDEEYIPTDEIEFINDIKEA